MINGRFVFGPLEYTGWRMGCVKDIASLGIAQSNRRQEARLADMGLQASKRFYPIYLYDVVCTKAKMFAHNLSTQ